MAKIVELKPNGTLSSTGWIVQFGGGAANPGSLHAALADDLPINTKVSGKPYTRAFDQQAVVAGDLRVTFDTYTLEADERCRRVQLSTIAQQGVARHRVGLGNGAVATEPLGRYEHRKRDVVEQLFGPWVPLAQNSSGVANQEWTQANIDDLRARITPVAAHFLGVAYYYRMRARLDIVQKPHPQLITPYESEVFPSINPTFRWETGVPEPQKKYELRIFTSATAEDDTFDILTSIGYIYTVKGTTSATSYVHKAPTPFQHGQHYYAFIKTAVDFNGSDWWSDWSPGIKFKINARPAVTVVAPALDSTVVDSAKPSIQWDYTDEEGDLQSAFRIVVLEKPSGGFVGIVDPNAESLNGNAFYDSGYVAAEVTDHALPLPLDNATTYRAYVQVRQRVPSVLDSSWAFTEFTTNYAAPPIPLLAAQPIADTAIDLNVTPGQANWMTADESSFETSTAGYAANTNTTISRVTTQFLHGVASLQITRAVSSAQAIVTAPAESGEAGKIYNGQIHVKSGSVARTARLRIRYFNTSFTLLRTDYGPDHTTVVGGWIRLEIIGAAAPAGTYQWDLAIEIDSVAIGELHFIDMVGAGLGDFTPEWALGGGTRAATLGVDDAMSTKTLNWMTRNQASLETDTTGWAPWTGNSTITRSLTVAKDGTASLRLERNTTTGDASAVTPIYPNGIPCVPGEELTFIAQFRAGTTSRTVYTNFVFYDLAGNTLPNPTYLSSNFATDNNAGWTQVKIRANAPADAYSFAVTVNAQNVPVGEFHYVDEMIIYRGDTSTWSAGDAHQMDVIDMRLRVGAILLDWTPGEDLIIAHRWDFVNDQECSWILWLMADGKFKFQWSTDGTEGLSKEAISTVANAFVNGSAGYVEVQFDNDNGASGQNVTFQTSTDGTTYSALGAVVTVATVEPIYNGLAELKVGGGGTGSGWQGWALRVELRNAVPSGGTLLADTIFNRIGTTGYRDEAANGGRWWVLEGDAEIEIKESPNPDFYILERSRDGGATWEFFRYDEGLLSDRIDQPLTEFTVRDHEVPLNKDVQYRVSALSLGLGYDSNSAPSAPVTAGVIGSYVTLKDTLDPAKNRRFRVADKWLVVGRTKNRQVYQPIGRRNPIVVRGSGAADTFEITFTILSEEEFEALLGLLDSDNLLFIQTPKGSWWAEVAGDLNFRAHIWDHMRGEEDVYQLAVPFQEVDRLDSNVASIA